MDTRTQRSLPEELPSLLDDRGLSLRGLAERAGVDKAFLSRVLRSKDGKRANPAMCRKIARALDLPEDYFPEVREAEVIKRVESDADLRDRIYRSISRPSDR